MFIVGGYVFLVYLISKGEFFRIRVVLFWGLVELGSIVIFFYLVLFFGKEGELEENGIIL